MKPPLIPKILQPTGPKLPRGTHSPEKTNKQTKKTTETQINTDSDTRTLLHAYAHICTNSAVGLRGATHEEVVPRRQS